MEMQGSKALAITQQQAWDALNDPEVLKLCIPGCDSIEATGEGAYALVNAIKVGPVSAKFKGSLQLADVQAPDSYTIHFEGSGGAAGFGKGSAQVTLAPNATGCELGYTVNATVGGKIAQVGQRLIDGGRQIEAGGGPGRGGRRRAPDRDHGRRYRPSRRDRGLGLAVRHLRRWAAGWLSTSDLRAVTV